MKKALIIGATSGIGKALAELLLQDNEAMELPRLIMLQKPIKVEK